MIDFYKKIGKSMKSAYHNPCFDQHGLEVPFRMLVCGSSGSYKSNFVLNVLSICNNTWDHIILAVKNVDEPLYAYLRSKVPEQQITICEGIEAIPELESLDPSCQYIAIFDDLVLEKKQSIIEQYFIRGRKIARGISSIYITQDYFRTSPVIRRNCNYIVLKKMSSARNLSTVLSDYNLPISKEELQKLYMNITKVPQDALMIDINKGKFRINFTEI